MAQIETLTSPLWPAIQAEIHREMVGGHKTVFRVKVASKEFPALATQRIFTTRDDAVGYAKTVLGFPASPATE